MAGNTQALQRSSSTARRWPLGGLAQRFVGSAGILAAQLLVGVVLLGGWELSAGTIIDTFFVSKPSLIAAELWRQATTGTLWRDLWVTIVQETLVGYAVGATLGIVLGFLLAQAPVAARILNPYLIAINGVPRIALAPLFIIWFGIGLTSKIWLAGMMAFFLAFFNTFAGVGGVERGHLNVARVMGAGRLELITKVVLPSASPWIITGLRLAIPYALVAAVVGEMVMSTAGIGHRIINATQTFNITGTMSGVIVLMLIVMLFNWLLDRFEARLLRWRPPSHEEPQANSQG
jgi:NitT/TauT family transport system permease protein